MPLLAVVLRANLDRIEGFSDKDCRTSCPNCGEMQSLDHASVDVNDKMETVYGCMNGCGAILIISIPGVIGWKGRGYRIKDWVIRNPSDLFFRPPGKAADVLMPGI